MPFRSSFKLFSAISLSGAIRMDLAAVFLLFWLLLLPLHSPVRAETFSVEELQDGFEKTVFGLEYRSWSWRPYLVKKFTKPVVFYVHSHSRLDRTPVVHRFIHEVDQKVRGLELQVTRHPEKANFEVYVVDRDQYSEIVQKDIYKDQHADVPGRCLVRVVSGRRGIKRSAAVIVSDEGEFLFRRCLVEEILQGLGPMNDNSRLTHSVFNDHSRHSRFTVFDQILLNMLYDPRIKPGMSKKQAQPLLSNVAREARRLVR